MPRQTTEPHLEGGGIYRKRWWGLMCAEKEMGDEDEL